MQAATGIVLACGALLAAGCGADTANVDCGTYVTWEDKQYEGFGDVRVARGRPVGSGRNPCRADLTRYELVSVPGVARELMLAEATRELVFVRRGALPVLRGFPLGSRFAFQRPIRRRCERPARLAVALTDEGNEGHVASSRTRAGQFVGLTFVPGSDVRAARTVAGQPRLRAGDRVVVSGFACPGRKFVHLRVAALRPAP